MHSPLFWPGIFCQNLWQWLFQIGQRLIAGLFMLLLPIGWFLGLFELKPDPEKSIALTPDPIPFTQLVPPERSYEEVRQPFTSDRRGEMVESRHDLEHPSLEIDHAAMNAADLWVARLPELGLPIATQTHPWPYQALLPNGTPLGPDRRFSFWGIEWSIV